MLVTKTVKWRPTKMIQKDVIEIDSESFKLNSKC